MLPIPLHEGRLESPEAGLWLLISRTKHSSPFSTALKSRSYQLQWRDRTGIKPVSLLFPWIRWDTNRIYSISILSTIETRL